MVSEQTETNPSSPQKKAPLRILRERRGGVPRALVEQNQRQNSIRRSILEVLREGPRTVPELARVVGLPPHDVFRHVVSLKKYGNVVEADQVDGYFQYAVTEDHTELSS